MSKDDQPVIGHATPLRPYPKDMRVSPGIPANSKVQVGDPSPTDVASNAPNVLTPDASKTTARAKQKLIERIKNMLPWVNSPDAIAEPIAQAWLEEILEARISQLKQVDGAFCFIEKGDTGELYYLPTDVVMVELQQRLAALKETQTNE